VLTKLVTFAIAIIIDILILKVFWGAVKAITKAPQVGNSMTVAKRIVTSAPKYALVKR